MDRLWSKILLLLLTGALINCKDPEELNVYLEPKNIKVCEGDSVTINCTFQPSGKSKLRLYYSPTYLDCNSGTKELHEKERINTENNASWSIFTINSIMTNESGWYFCQVIRDIPVLVQKCSNGTWIQVDNSAEKYPNERQTPNPTQNRTTQESPTTCLITTPTIPTPPSSFTQWWIWLALSVGCSVLLVSIVVICILTRKPEEIIYENTKPVEPSCWRRDRAKMDMCDLPSSKKTDTIKPLRKYDTLSSNRIRRP